MDCEIEVTEEQELKKIKKQNAKANDRSQRGLPKVGLGGEREWEAESGSEAGMVS